MFKATSSHLFLQGLFLLVILIMSCNDDPYKEYSYDPSPLELNIPDNYPPVRIPDDNPFTIEGISLGRSLFYDPIISANKDFNCSSCHRIGNAFSDTLRFSPDSHGILKDMNTMPLFNVGFYPRYGWRGNIESIEQDVAVTIAELHGDWEQLIAELEDDPEYKKQFYEAFGIEGIDAEQVEKAIAQYVRSLLSFRSRFDSIFAGSVAPTEMEMRGYELFFTEEGDCFHCHIDPLFTNLGFHNNALDNEEDMDPGFELVTGSALDRGKFKVPSLRNLAYTAPYMHDGRFKTLKEVVDFYSEGLNQSPYADSNMKNVHKGGIQISEPDKEALIAFLLTLSDPGFVSNPELSDPKK